ncbi:MAG TPA: SirB1 family protein [Xanthomonadaceae bacterium]|jgi:regulator of sirC expression with transglutaminase-like and TPR domain|nr:SirB1 family protein [Xanthomonadaceae bacterium]
MDNSRNAATTNLPAWDALARMDDDALPLLGTALLIARDEYPELQPGPYDAMVQGYVEAVRVEVQAQDSAPARMAVINRFLFDEVGFGGNNEAYSDPRNSYLNDVFERKLGIPISLAVVQMEIARRLDVPLDGISFPGHFLVRLPVDDGILVMDPYNKGRSLSADELRDRVSVHCGGQSPDDAELLHILAPATHRMILLRMLRNLKALYADRNDWERVARSSDRLLKLAPSLGEEVRDRGLAYLKLGHVAGARDDLTRYLQVQPEAPDVEAIRSLLIEATGKTQRLN